MYQFDGPLSKIGISRELSIYFMNGIHPIEGNYSLYNKKKKLFYPNLNFRKYHDFKHFFTVFELLNISTLTNHISIDRIFSSLFINIKNSIVHCVDLFREHYREYLTSHPNRYTLSLKLEVLAIVMGGGGCKEFPPFKRGGGHKKLYPVLKRGGGNKFRTRDFPIL